MGWNMFGVKYVGWLVGWLVGICLEYGLESIRGIIYIYILL